MMPNSDFFRLDFIMETNTMEPDQSDLGPYCLQYELPKEHYAEE